MNLPDLDKLRSQLLVSGIQNTNQPLWQVINTLIDYLKKSNQELGAAIGTGGGGGSIPSDISNQHYLTHQNDLATLPFSRELLPGTGVTFDDSIAGQRTVNSSGANREWSVLTNGDVTNPELIFVGGDVIMLHTP